jgi:hypothetical protein
MDVGQVVTAAVGEPAVGHGRYVIVSGDWLLEPDEDDPLFRIGYAAEVDDKETWSGGVCPRVSRHVAEVILQDQDLLHGDGTLGEESGQLRWEGDTIVYTQDGTDVERTEPDSLGRYPVSFGWTWQSVAAVDCRHIIFGSHLLERALSSDVITGATPATACKITLPRGTEISTTSQSGASIEFRVLRGPGTARRLAAAQTVLAVRPAQLRWAITEGLERPEVGTPTLH